MRKKLLALVMCATMVLGTAVTAVAAPSNDDYKNADTILKQYNADKGNIIGEYNAKKENVKFTTEYVKKTVATDNAGQADADKTTDKAPKTGDVAPIAALAVVMMGAFGAMVVASKKRA